MANVDGSEEDFAALRATFASLQSGAKDVMDKGGALVERAEVEADDALVNGLSFLTAKCNLLLAYVIDLALLSLRKCSGASIVGSPSIARLIEARTYLEKMRPIDHKLRYQIDKLIRIAASGGLGAGDALLLKANPENLASKLGDEDDDDVADADGSRAEAKVYRPPKMTAAFYADASGEERASAAAEKAKKRALSSSVMQELRREYYEGPEEIVDAVHAVRGDKELARKRKYEEENFVRLTVSKAERQRMKRLQDEAAFGALTRFEDIGALTGADAAPDGRSSSSKPQRKGKDKRKRGKANKFKRRK